MNNFITGTPIRLAEEFDNRFVNTSKPNSQNRKCRKGLITAIKFIETPLVWIK